MFVAFAICATLTTLCGAVPNVGFRTVVHVGDQNEARSSDAYASKLPERDRPPIGGLTKYVLDTAFPEYSTKTRKKRMVPVVSKAVLALTKLLSKSKGVTPYTTYTKTYMRRGNFGVAIQDFESFGPKFIKHRKTGSGVRVIEGRTEGFKFKVRSPGYKRDSEAVFEITEFGAKKGDPKRTYSILYVKKDQLY